MRSVIAVVLAILMPVQGIVSAQAHDKSIAAQLQELAHTYIAGRGSVEGISAVSLYTDLGSGHKPIWVYSGKTDGSRNAKSIDSQTLFQIGSNTKHFTAALVLKLEAMGKLNIDQTVGDWLPRYPSWRHVTIRSLLNMTAPIPNYLETVEIGALVANDIHHQFAPEQLIAAVDPNNGKHLPTPSGWFYSNTNNTLAGLIIEAASGMSYKDALETMIIKPLGLHDTFYSDGAYSDRVLHRMPAGIYENPECLLYQPVPCSVSTLAPLIGRDLHAQNMSWAGAAGGMVSTPRDVAKWIRALFQLRVFPRQQLDEMTSIVSTATGLPIPDVSAADPSGFGLDLGRIHRAEPVGTLWFYQGTTLGFRTVFAYWPQYNLVITASTNSQPPRGQDQFIADVIIPALLLLTDRRDIPHNPSHSRTRTPSPQATTAPAHHSPEASPPASTR